ncbi:uncharacterized protein LOC111475813 [Cucurbita maxima]|uniref:Uncharacterized protein LOC111475813 n=1 Tax=Cucurbita maxima TaxID=3661 RepID=A0A6J1IHI4_CUCMA|nr:uncharacterized protein LOC111475813 [Cucurbita maxima]
MASLPLATGSRRSQASFYDVLRVKNNASSIEIKTAYRSLAKIYHPDSARRSECDSSSSDDDYGNGCSFLEIHSAYETLSDLATRAQYDLALASFTRRNGLNVLCIGGIFRSLGRTGDGKRISVGRDLVLICDDIDFCTEMV